MTSLRSLITAAALVLLLGAAPSSRAEAAPSQASGPVQAAPERAGSNEASDDYAAREEQAPELAKFKGGEHEHIYIGSTVVVVLLVVLIIVLIR